MKKYFWITISTLCIISWWFLIELADPSGTLLGRALMYGLLLFIVFFNVFLARQRNANEYEYYLVGGIGLTGIFLLMMLIEYIFD
jgi:hypothetical protein